jgi:hypothetical protein
MSNVQESADLKNESSNLPSSGEPKRKRGRPKGSKNKNIDPVLVDPPRCKKCGCTEITTLRTDRKSLKGIRNGEPFNRITYRRIRCTSCKQVGILRFFELIKENI